MTRNDVQDFIENLEDVREWRDGVNGNSWKIEKTDAGFFNLYKTSINGYTINPRYIASFFGEGSFLAALQMAWGGNIATAKEWIVNTGIDEEETAKEVARWNEKYPDSIDDLYLLAYGSGKVCNIERFIY